MFCLQKPHQSRIYSAKSFIFFLPPIFSYALRFNGQFSISQFRFQYENNGACGRSAPSSLYFLRSCETIFLIFVVAFSCSVICYHCDSLLLFFFIRATDIKEQQSFIRFLAKHCESVGNWSHLLPSYVTLFPLSLFRPMPLYSISIRSGVCFCGWTLLVVSLALFLVLVILLFFCPKFHYSPVIVTINQMSS